MSTWGDALLAPFDPLISRLVLVADPDRLLDGETTRVQLEARGFSLLTFDDPVRFRLQYESEWRSHWDRGEEIERALILQLHGSNLDQLPYDLLQLGYAVHLSLADLFPRFSYGVIRTLDTDDLEALYAIGQPGGALGDNGTLDFLLERLFGFHPAVVRSGTDALRLLLHLHSEERELPPVVAARLIQRLRTLPALADWPLDQIVSDRIAFHSFLQERWPLFLDRVLTSLGHAVSEPSSDYGLHYSGPAQLPLDEPGIRTFVDTLFLDEALKPVEHQQADLLRDHWVTVGLRSDAESDRVRRAERLIESLEPQEFPTTEGRYRPWFVFARRWAELNVAWYALTGKQQAPLHDRFSALQFRIDMAFRTWLTSYYGGLYAQAPAMVHHAIDVMARCLEEAPHKRVAIVVIDGLSLAQWSCIEETLRSGVQSSGSKVSMQSSALFAWVPTITAVSRQAIFAGTPPSSFASSIGTTNAEESLWRRAWQERGYGAHQVIYQRGIENSQAWTVFRGDTLLARHRIAGIVLSTVDSIMHGERMGMSGMFSAVRDWVERGPLISILSGLVTDGFTVFITSDHGNVEAQGMGRPSREGVLAKERGQRARVYESEALRDDVAGQSTEAVAWPPLGLPLHYWPLLAPDYRAFLPPGETSVTHGGIALEEVIVPLVRLEGKQL